MKSNQSRYALLAALLLADHVSASTFSDDFNRPDSSTIGNGWFNATTTTSGAAGTLQITNNEATFANTVGARAGIYRPADFTGSFTIDATLKEMNGFGGLPRRYDQNISIFNDGTIGHGYGLNIGRSDSNFNNSYITLLDGTTALSTIQSTFQFGAAIDTHVTFSLDGSVVGTISQGSSHFDFSFGSHTIQSSGTNFLYSTSSPDNRTSSFIFPRVDNVTLTSTPPPQRLFGLTIGQNAAVKLRGDKGADRVFNKLSQASTWAGSATGNSTAPLIFTDNFTQNLGAQVTSSLNSMSVRPGDTVVFYYNGHGGPLSLGDGGETPILLNGVSNSQDEFFASDLSDDSLYQLFSQPKWAGVRKIFLLDSCHSGGFLGTAGAGDIGDLEKLSNFALFASAAEDSDALPEDSLLSFALGEFGNYGMGVWTARGLLPALDVESLTTANLQSLINGNLTAATTEYASASHAAFDINDPSARVFAGFHTTTVLSNDFDASQSFIPTPEPTSSVLLLCGAAMCLRRRSLRTHERNA